MLNSGNNCVLAYDTPVLPVLVDLDSGLDSRKESPGGIDNSMPRKDLMLKADLESAFVGL